MPLIAPPLLTLDEAPATVNTPADALTVPVGYHIFHLGTGQGALLLPAVALMETGQPTGAYRELALDGALALCSTRQQALEVIAQHQVWVACGRPALSERSAWPATPVSHKLGHKPRAHRQHRRSA